MVPTPRVAVIGVGVTVQRFGEEVPATVAATPLVDPSGAGVRG